MRHTKDFSTKRREKKTRAGKNILKLPIFLESTSLYILRTQRNPSKYFLKTHTSSYSVVKCCNTKLKKKNLEKQPGKKTKTRHI